MPNVCLFNPRPQIDIVTLSDGGACLVIDDALTEPERLVQFAVTERESFRPVDFNAYPGIYRLLPQITFEALRDFFVQHLRSHFDARRLQNMHARFSMVTTPPNALRPCQWICHSDGANLPPDRSIQASVLYLFKDTGLGGTSFYRPIQSAKKTAEFFADSNVLSAEAFAHKYAMQPGYMHRSNAFFEHVGRIDARWNRMIFYDGAMLHSGDIFAPEKLSADPQRGRLTVNGFFTCRRHAA